MTQAPITTVANYSSEDLTNLTTWDELGTLFQNYGVTLLDAGKVLGDGFQILQDKRKLVGVELVILEWRHSNGANGSFTSMRVAARADNGSVLKYIVNDGGVGIHQELTDLTAKGLTGGLKVNRGFSASDYDYTDPATGDARPATTYYLDTSA